MMTESVETENIFVLVCQAICEAGRPLSRMEIAKAIEPRTVPNLKDILEGMLRSGTLVSYMSAGEHNTAIVRYQIADQAACGENEIGGRY